MMRSALYAGELLHTRRDRFARRTFRYPMYVAAIDLAELPQLARDLRLFSHNRLNAFALHDRDYRDAQPGGLLAAHHARLAAHGLAPAPRTTLVTQLRVANYVFNPVSFFLDHDDRGDLVQAVAEVNNNYGGNHPYVLGPAQRLQSNLDPDRQSEPILGERADLSRPARIAASLPTYRVAKEFFVSPFLHGPATYDFAFATPADSERLAITMHVKDPAGEPIFHAHLTGERRPLSDRTLAWAALRYPFMTAQVIGLIYWEALKLHRLGVPFRRPGPDHGPGAAIPADPAAAPARNHGMPLASKRTSPS